jgi:hypothetical protein
VRWRAQAARHAHEGRHGGRTARQREARASCAECGARGWFC